MLHMTSRIDRYTRLAGILGCTATLAFAGCAANGNVTPTSSSAHVLVYVPTRYDARAVVPDSSAGVGPLAYNNGPVLLKPKAYLIFWGYKKYGDPDKVAPLLKAYFKAVGGSDHDNIYTQYFDIVESQKNFITNSKRQLGGVWFDETNSVPPNPDDAQVAKEALNGVAKFGYDANASYVVATPHGRSTQGFGTQFCAYHSDTQQGSNLVSYTNLPYVPDAGAPCGADLIAPPKDESGTDEGVTIVEGGAYGASITDPDPGTGWYSFEYGEITECPWTDVQNDPFGKKSYTTGAMYSNASQTCVQEYYARQ